MLASYCACEVPDFSDVLLQSCLSAFGVRPCRAGVVVGPICLKADVHLPDCSSGGQLRSEAGTPRPVSGARSSTVAAAAEV